MSQFITVIRLFRLETVVSLFVFRTILDNINLIHSQLIIFIALVIHA